MNKKALTITVAEYENREKYHDIIARELEQGWCFDSEVLAHNIVIIQFKKDAAP